MFNKKSLTERVLELKEKYLQPADIIQKIGKTVKNAALITTISAMLLGHATSVFSSEPLNVKEYTKQNNYNLSTIFQLYLKPLNENGLDENEKKAIDIIADILANAPKEKQEEGKALAKAIYNNGQLTPDILEKLENLNLPEEQEQVNGLEEKVIQEPENPVDIYAVIANGEDDETDDGKFFGWSITSALEFYKLMKNIGVSDDNITLFLYHPNTDDIINTLTKEWLDYYHFGSTPLPSSKSEVSIDEEKVTLNKVLDAISAIPSDDNDFVYIMLSSHANPEYTIRFPNGRLSYQSLRKAIKKIDNYGKIFVILDSCYAGGFLEPLEKVHDYIGIGASSSKKQPFAGVLPLMINKYLRENPNILVSELIEKANQYIVDTKYYEKRDSLIVVFSSDKKLLDESLIPDNYLTQ